MSSYGQVTASQIASQIPASTTMQNAASGTGNGTSLPSSGYATAVLNITGAGMTGSTVVFEGSVDDTTFVPMLGTQVGTTTTGTTATSVGDWVLSVSGYKSVRARISVYGGSGTITVKGYTSVLSAGSAGGGAGGAVTQSGTWAVQLLDSGGTNKASISSAGAVKVEGVVVPSPSTQATYRCTTGIFTPATSATDMVILNGSSTKTVRVLAIYVNFYGSASNVINNFYLIKRVAANSGGTSVADTELKQDINNASPTAAMQHYTANPTLGTTSPGGGTLEIITLVPHSSSSNNYQGKIALYEAEPNSQGLVLRGTAEGLAVNNNGTTVPSSSSVGFTFVWIEE